MALVWFGPSRMLTLSVWLTSQQYLANVVANVHNEVRVWEERDGTGSRRSQSSKNNLVSVFGRELIDPVDPSVTMFGAVCLCLMRSSEVQMRATVNRFCLSTRRNIGNEVKSQFVLVKTSEASITSHVKSFPLRAARGRETNSG